VCLTLDSCSNGALLRPSACAGHKSNNEKGSIYMVFDYMEHDMTGLLQRVNLTGRSYTPAQVSGAEPTAWRTVSRGRGWGC
jgi:hypothetical protein